MHRVGTRAVSVRVAVRDLHCRTPLYQHQPVFLTEAVIKADVIKASFLHQNGDMLVRHEVQRLVHELT